MPGVDWIPGVSQIKAIAQIATGDKDGAAETIENFHKECPGFSQLTSLVQIAKGDFKGAKETQKRCLGTINNVANGTPLVGHLKVAKMPGVDWIPGVSQIKAIAQIATGDKDGAAETIENFHKECPGFSQLTSLVQIAKGDFKGAKETQKRCLGTINNVANGTPLVGHLKGVAHHIAGDHEGRDQAFNAANRSTVVVGSGVAAGLASGGIAAIPAGMAAGTLYDVAATKITGKEQGYVAALKKAYENPSASTIIDVVAVQVGDALAGYSGGQIGEQFSSSTVQPQSVGTQAKLSSLEAARAAKLDILNGELAKTAAAGEGMTTGQVVAIGKEIKALTSEISLIKDGTPKFWTDLKPVKPQTNPVAVPIVRSYDNDNEAIQKLPGNVTGTVNVVIGTTASVASFAPRLNERNTQSNENVQPWDYSNIKHYIYQQQQDIFKLFNRQKPEEEFQRDFAPNYLEEFVAHNSTYLEILKQLLSRDDAIYYDSYLKNSWNDLFIEHYNYQDRQNTLKLFNNQKAENELNLHLVPLFLEKNLIKVRDVNSQKENDPEKDVDERELNRMLHPSWLHLNLPEDLFSYTAFVQLNNDNEGLYHSLIRHIDQWMEFVNFDEELIDRLSPIMNEITEMFSVNADSNYISALNTPADSREQAREVREKTKEVKEKLRKALKNLSQKEYQNIKRALLRIQILMYDFIENNVTSCQYIRTVTNADNHVQLHFKVKTKNGETKVMVVCVSKEIYKPVTSVDKRQVRTVKTIYFRPWYEDAIFYDSYVRNSWGYFVASDCSKDQKENILNYQDKRKPTNRLDLLFVPLFLAGDLNRIRASNLTRNAQDPPNHLLRRSFLHLKLPEQEKFSYTAFIQANNDNDGLLHSLIRHIDQWREFIEFDQDLINRLNPIINEIEELVSVIEDNSTSDSKNLREAREKAEEAREKLRNVLKNLSKDDCQNVKRALLKIQILLYDFIEKNVTTPQQYIGRNLNADGLEQLHFKVKTLKGETKIMVICVSSHLYEPVSFMDERPIRKVMTVFFKSWDDDFIFRTYSLLLLGRWK